MKRSLLLVLLIIGFAGIFIAYQNAGVCEPEWQSQKTLETANTAVARCEDEGETVIWDDASGSFSRPTVEVIDEGSGTRHVRVYSCDDLHRLRFEVRLEQLTPGCTVAQAGAQSGPDSNSL